MTAIVDVRVTDLAGQALDWAVAQVCISDGLLTDNREDVTSGLPLFTMGGGPSLFGAGREQKGTHNRETGKPWVLHGPGGSYSPSTDWHQGGPLIDKHAIGFVGHDTDNWLAFAAPADEEHQGVGPTHLIAACRLIVRAALGETVSVPAELVQAVQP